MLLWMTEAETSPSSASRSSCKNSVFLILSPYSSNRPVSPVSPSRKKQASSSRPFQLPQRMRSFKSPLRYAFKSSFRSSMRPASSLPSSVSATVMRFCIFSREKKYQQAYITNMYGYYGYGMWLLIFFFFFLCKQWFNKSRNPLSVCIQTPCYP